MSNVDLFNTPELLENLRRSIVMLGVGQKTNIDRERALNLISELQRLQNERHDMIDQLRALLSRLEHPTSAT